MPTNKKKNGVTAKPKPSKKNGASAPPKPRKRAEGRQKTPVDPRTVAAKKSTPTSVKGERHPKSLKKERYRALIVGYLSDIENEPVLSRQDLAKIVLGVGKQTLYKHFSPVEIAEIESEGLALRRRAIAPIAAQVDSALVKMALSGDVPAIKLFYQRLENWAPASNIKVEVEYNLDMLRERAISLGFDPEEYIAQYLAVKAESAHTIN